LSGIQRDAFGADDEFTEYWNNEIDIEALFSTILSSVTVGDSGTWTMDDNVVLADVKAVYDAVGFDYAAYEVTDHIILETVKRTVSYMLYGYHYTEYDPYSELDLNEYIVDYGIMLDIAESILSAADWEIDAHDVIGFQWIDAHYVYNMMMDSITRTADGAIDEANTDTETLLTEVMVALGIDYLAGDVWYGDVDFGVIFNYAYQFYGVSALTIEDLANMMADEGEIDTVMTGILTGFYGLDNDTEIQPFL
jgi:hypothetical protein